MAINKYMKALATAMLGALVMTGVAGVDDAEAKKKKGNIHIKVKFCGLVGSPSNFSNLTWLPDNKNVQAVYSEKKLPILVSSFNGKDKSMTTARRIKKLKVGEQKTFECNPKKGGCKFRIQMKEKASSAALKVDFGEYHYKGHMFFAMKKYNSGAFKDRSVVVKIEKLKTSTKIRNWCNFVSNTRIGCQYNFNDSKVSVVAGTTC